MKVPMNEYRIRPEGLPTVRERDNYSPEHFGAGVAGSMEKNAKRIGVGVDLFREQADQKKKLEQELELSIVKRQYQDEIAAYNYGENGVMNAELLNAKGMPERVRSGMSGIRANIASNIQDPEVRMLFENSAMDLETRFAGSAYAREGEQLILARKAEEKTSLDSLTNNIVIAVRSGNRDAVPDFLSDSSSYIEEMGKANGWTDSMIYQQKKVFAGQALDGAISNLLANGQPEEAKKLYGEAAPMIGYEYLNKWDDAFRIADEKAVLAEQKRLVAEEKARKEQLWNDFLLSDPKDPQGREFRNGMMEEVRASGDGVLYDKMKKRNLEDKDSTKESDLQVYSDLNHLYTGGKLTKSEVFVAYENGTITHSDAKSFLSGINKQEQEGWDEVDQQQMELAKNYIHNNIKKPEERNQALSMVRMGNKKGPEIFTYAKNIVDTDSYKTGTTGFFGSSKPKGYTATEAQMEEKAKYWEQHGEDTVHRLDQITGNWDQTKLILDIVGIKANDPVIMEVVRQIQEMGPLDRPLTSGEIIQLVKDARYEYERSRDDEY